MFRPPVPTFSHLQQGDIDTGITFLLLMVLPYSFETKACSWVQGHLGGLEELEAQLE